jgi:fatty acid desaturase
VARALAAPPTAPTTRVADLDRAFLYLRRQVTDAHLLEPTYGYYLRHAVYCFALLAFGITIGWRVPALAAFAAALIAFGSVQLGFTGHDAGHRAVFRSTGANVALGVVCWSLVLGIGFWYWNHRHLRHHAHVNDLEADPDLKWTRQRAPSGAGGRLRRMYQFVQAPGLVLGLAFLFRLEGWDFALRRLNGRRRHLELALLAASLVLWLTPCLVVGPRWLLVYVGAQILGGLYLGATIAPNHKGMVTWPAGSRAGFVERQVLSSRNVRPGRLVDFVLGGLNYQIEHHLFPYMSRAHLNRARTLVRQFCGEQGLAYDERGVVASYRIVLRELRAVGPQRTSGSAV